MFACTPLQLLSWMNVELCRRMPPQSRRGLGRALRNFSHLSLGVPADYWTNLRRLCLGFAARTLMGLPGPSVVTSG